MIEAARKMFPGVVFHHVDLDASASEDLRVIFKGHNDAHEVYNSTAKMRLSLVGSKEDHRVADRQSSDAWDEVEATN